MRTEASRNLLSQTVRRVLLFFWALSLAAVIAGSLVSGTLLERLDPVEMFLNDKQQHFLAYLGLAMLPPLAFDRCRSSWLLAASMLALGAGLEYAQRLTPDRQFDYADMQADGLGVAAGMLLSWLVSSYLTGRWKRRPSD